jgi:hypothetical protein
MLLPNGTLFLAERARKPHFAVLASSKNPLPAGASGRHLDEAPCTDSRSPGNRLPSQLSLIGCSPEVRWASLEACPANLVANYSVSPAWVRLLLAG